MKKTVLCLGMILIAFSLLYAQQTPKTQRQQEQQPNEEFSGPRQKMQTQLKDRRENMLQQMKNEDPETQAMHQELLKLEQNVKELAEKYKAESSVKEQNKIKNEIQNTLNEAFDLKLMLEEKKLEQLKNKLNELEKLSEERKSNKKEIIEKRLEFLLQQKENLGW